MSLTKNGHTIFILGNLTRDPDMKYTPNGDAICNFGVASNERWTDSNGETQERVTWWRISAWRKLGETCNQFLKKGRLVLIEGTMKSKDGNPVVWTDREGNPRASFEVTALGVKFLDKGNGNGNGGSTATATVADDDEIPF